MDSFSNQKPSTLWSALVWVCESVCVLLCVCMCLFVATLISYQSIQLLILTFYTSNTLVQSNNVRRSLLNSIIKWICKYACVWDGNERSFFRYHFFSQIPDRMFSPFSPFSRFYSHFQLDKLPD